MAGQRWSQCCAGHCRLQSGQACGWWLSKGAHQSGFSNGKSCGAQASFHVLYSFGTMLISMLWKLHCSPLAVRLSFRDLFPTAAVWFGITASPWSPVCSDVSNQETGCPGECAPVWSPKDCVDSFWESGYPSVADSHSLSPAENRVWIQGPAGMVIRQCDVQNKADDVGDAEGERISRCFSWVHHSVRCGGTEVSCHINFSDVVDGHILSGETSFNCQQLNRHYQTFRAIKLDWVWIAIKKNFKNAARRAQIRNCGDWGKATPELGQSAH